MRHLKCPNQFETNLKLYVRWKSNETVENDEQRSFNNIVIVMRARLRHVFNDAKNVYYLQLQQLITRIIMAIDRSHLSNSYWLFFFVFGPWSVHKKHV